MTAATLPEVRSEVLRILRECVGCATPAGPTTRLHADLQLDSLAMLTLVVELEDRYRVPLDGEATAGTLTVDDLAAQVVRAVEVRRAS